MTARINYCANPTFDSWRSDGFADGWTDNDATPSQVRGRILGLALRLQYVGGTSDINCKTSSWAGGSFASGDPATFSCYVKGSSSGVTTRLQITTFDAEGVWLGYTFSDVFTLTGDWQRVSVTRTCDPLTASVFAGLDCRDITAGDTLDVTIDDALIEKSASVGAYFDWKTPGSYRLPDFTSVQPDFDIQAILQALGALGSPLQAASYIPPVERPYDGPWERRGVVLVGSETWEGIAVQEPSVILDGSTWKMWYHGGWYTGTCIGYATASSPEGPWTKYASNPVLEGYRSPSVFKLNGIYHMMACQFPSVDHLTSPDGIHWTLSAAALIGLGDNGWNSGWFAANTWTWEEGGTWYMLIEGQRTGENSYTTGLATAASLDGPWTQYAGNPILGSSTFSTGGPCVIQKGGRLYQWFHGCGTGVIPTDIYRAHGSSPYSWTVDARPLFVRATTDEGAGSPFGQVADPSVVEDDGVLYMFHTAVETQDGPFIIKLATAPITDMASTDAKLNDVLLKTNTIGAHPLTVTSPVAASGTITIEQGDSYPAGRSRAIDVNVDDVAHVRGLDAENVTVYLLATQFTWTASSVTETVPGYRVRFEPTIAETTALTTLRQSYKLKACIDNVAPTDDDAETIVRGTVVLNRDIPRIP